MKIAIHLKNHAACRMKAGMQQPCHENPRLAPSKTFRCFQCSYKTKSESDISNHLLSHANSLHVCQKCKRKFDTIENLRSHHQNFHKNQPELTKSAAPITPTTAKNNAMVQPRNTNPVVKKDDLKNRFMSKIDLKIQNPPLSAASVSCEVSSTPLKHQVISSPSVSNVIKAAITKPTNLETQMAKTSKSSVSAKKKEAKPPFCFLCNVHFLNADEYQSHLKFTHQNESVYSCCYCDEVFASNFGLTCHKDNIHKYKCNVTDCNKVFFDPADFKSHMAGHKNKNVSMRK